MSPVYFVPQVLSTLRGSAPIARRKGIPNLPRLSPQRAKTARRGPRLRLCRPPLRSVLSAPASPPLQGWGDPSPCALLPPPSPGGVRHVGTCRAACKCKSKRQGAATMSRRIHKNRPSIYQTITDRILASLKAGVIPWEKPWKSPRFAGGPFPRNFSTGRPYRGINVLLLWASDYSSPFWLTFKQAQELKGNVRKGEHGTPIVFYRQLAEDQKKQAANDGDEDTSAPFDIC